VKANHVRYSLKDKKPIGDYWPVRPRGVCGNRPERLSDGAEADWTANGRRIAARM